MPRSATAGRVRPRLVKAMAGSLSRAFLSAAAELEAGERPEAPVDTTDEEDAARTSEEPPSGVRTLAP